MPTATSPVQIFKPCHHVPPAGSRAMQCCQSMAARPVRTTRECPPVKLAVADVDGTGTARRRRIKVPQIEATSIVKPMSSNCRRRPGQWVVSTTPGARHRVRRHITDAAPKCRVRGADNTASARLSPPYSRGLEDGGYGDQPTGLSCRPSSKCRFQCSSSWSIISRIY